MKIINLTLSLIAGVVGIVLIPIAILIAIPDIVFSIKDALKSK